jgi:hypothetical protein
MYVYVYVRVYYVYKHSNHMYTALFKTYMMNKFVQFVEQIDRKQNSNKLH